MSRVMTKTQVSAGGVVFRRSEGRTEVVLISVGEQNRWQLPKGLVDACESPEEAARREAREETGLDAELIAPIEKIEYWYFSTERGARVRFHKFVHFYFDHASRFFVPARTISVRVVVEQVVRRDRHEGALAAMLLQPIDGSSGINTSI
jgi:8-oxo-dGTP pyrophosphatase MutT (NUDIX family)